MMVVVIRAFALLLLVALQGSVGLRLAIAGVPPDLPLAAVMAYAFDAGPVRGALAGLCAGGLLDLLRGVHLGMFALAAALAGWVCGEAAARVDPSRASVRWVIATAGAGLYAVVIVACSMLYFRDGVHATGILRHAALGLLYDGTLACLLYWPMHRLGPAPAPRPRALPLFGLRFGGRR